MKLRIKGNSIRLRLTSSEVNRLPVEKVIKEVTGIGEYTFSYSIHSYNDHIISAQLFNNHLQVFIPERVAQEWPSNNTISLNGSMLNADGSTLSLLIEKDFKCLNNTAEDQSDNFENPHKSC